MPNVDEVLFFSDHCTELLFFILLWRHIRMKEKVHKVHLKDEFRICPVCSYRDGFHTMLRRENGEVKTIYICPSCHELFEVDIQKP